MIVTCDDDDDDDDDDDGDQGFWGDVTGYVGLPIVL